ncbi:MAG: ATP-binding cassette domain-containing protein, partial [Pseudomonadota bacterium]
ERKRFHAAAKNSYRQSMKMVQTSATHTPLLQLIVGSALATLIFLALKVMPDASAGEFIAYITAAALIPKPVRQLSEVNATIQRGIAAAETIFDTIDEPAEQDDGDHSVERTNGKLEFKSLCFAYKNGGKPVLRHISFTVRPGQTVALVGHSGSGKSTLASLIPRFYDYQQGAILLDDIEITRYTLKNLRQQIALVTQQVTLFNDSIERNIAYGALQDASREEVTAAAAAANALDFINALPEGFDTLIGENGVKLSGGQRQRLAIARALLKDAPILILDEATSALDTESERKIQQALELAMQGRTTIVIAHRLSTIEKADVILVMHRGKIVESGSHGTLLAKDGHYAQFYKMQFNEEYVARPSKYALPQQP